MGKVISLLNHKGGVGKTTSCINIGAGLVELGKKVLLIDLDPQANLTLSLGIPRQQFTIYEALRGESELVPYTAKEGLDVIISTLDLSGAEAMQGLTKIKQVIDKVRFRLNKQLEIGGVIATMYDGRKVLNRDVVETIKKYFGEKVFNTYIRDNVALAEAPAQRQDIFSYNRSSPGAKDYLSLCKEIIERVEGVEVEA